MIRSTRTLLGAILTAAILGGAAMPHALAGDWPAYRHDVQRTSVSDEALAFPLAPAWHYVAPQPPSPAWPDTFRLLNRTDFDYAPQPVIAAGLVFFGSSSDDAVRALDAATGQEKWRFITGGPVRFAPQIDAGKAYFASDDGFAYCLDAATGKLLWKFQASPRDERMVGNHRMISRWPVRTGVLVADGTVYLAAGMWNMEGVFVYALRADSGQLIWCNDTLGVTGNSIVDFPATEDPRKQTVGGHNGEFAVAGSNPQGALLLSGDVLVIPNGNSSPTTLDRRTGLMSPKGGGGGAPVLIDQEKVYSFSRHHEDILAFRPVALGANPAGRGWAKEIPQVKITAPTKFGQIQDRTKVSAIVRDGKLFARKAYGLALLGETLIIGEQDAVVAQVPDTERVVWRGAVKGEARGIAAANGRLYVSTSTGDLYCFAPAPRGAAQAPAAAPVTHDPAAAIRAAASAVAPEPTSPVGKLLEELRASGMDRGFALVVGDPQAQLAIALATHTQLRVVMATTDEAAAATLRERLLTQTAFHGSRIHVQPVARLDQLPFAQFFANAVILAPGIAANALAPATAKELYRVLRPCGGILAAPGLTPAQAEALWRDSGAPADEIQQAQAGGALARGKLPGALDWDSPKRTGVSADQRVKWPLRPLWFGGPGTVQVQAVSGGGGPVLANGRYFVLGEQTIAAIDAYNGSVLWTQPLPPGNPAYTTVDGVVVPRLAETTFGRDQLGFRCQADDDFVYLTLASAYFQPIADDLSSTLEEATKLHAKRPGVIQLDARTGAQVKIAAPFDLPKAITLAAPRKWTLEVDPRRSGTVSMEASERGLVLTLTTKDPVVTRLDAWELFFDFRPPDTRYGLYGRGTFRARIVVAQDKNTPPACSSGAWAAEQTATPRPPVNPLPDPALEVTGTREPTGTKTIAVLPWSEVVKLVGSKPASFGFGATLNLHDGGREEPIATRHLFCDWTAPGLNNGWACVLLDAAATPAAAAAFVAKRPSILADALQPRGGVGGNGDYVTPVRAAPRVHPLTFELEPKMFRVSGCGGLSTSQVIRSGSQSIYDFEDDSGMRTMNGVKARCSTPQVAALGLLIYSEEAGHCECPYPVRTTLVMAPAERRLNEDWAFFFARPVDTYVRQAAINLGALGDRRDGEGTLWLGYPRIPADRSMAFPLVAGTDRSVGSNGVWLRIMSAMLQLPLDIECFALPGAEPYRPQEDIAAPLRWMAFWSPKRNNKPLGPYRFNADRTEILGTDRPWLYASGYRGIKKVAVQLDVIRPVVSVPIDKPPALPDKLDGPAWKAGPQAHLPFTRTDVFVRHDADNLHILTRRPVTVDRLGNVSRWSKAASGKDAAVWDDDSFEVFLSDAGSGRVVHLGVSASGARFDALSQDGKKEDSSWDAPWQSAVMAEQSEASLKAAITPTNPVPDDQTLVALKPPKPADAGGAAVPGLDPDAAPKKPPGATSFRGDEPSPLLIQLSIPWKTIEAAGLKRDRLAINLQTNQRDISGMPATSPGVIGRAPPSTGEALSYLGIEGRSRCLNFAPLGVGAPPPASPRSFTVRLHFAEPDDVMPGQRVFDVKVQQQVVLKAFDVAREANGPRTALIKEFKGIRAAGEMTVEFIPAASEIKPDNAPILSAIELVEEGLKPLALAPPKAEKTPAR